jgi:Glutamine synthetase, catalytic domain
MRPTNGNSGAKGNRRPSRYWASSTTVGDVCFAAQLMAGFDGIPNRIDPGEPIDKDPL